MTEHRVSMLGSTLRRHEDPTKSRDPKVQAVMAELKAAQVRAIEIAPAPRAHFRAELRAQLVAVAPRIIADGKAETAAMVDIVPRPRPRPRPSPSPVAAAEKAGSKPSFAERLRRIPIARPLAVVASVVTVFALLLGGAVWMSQKSLPGDALYGLKRASENVQLSLASNNVDRAKDYLDFAGTRVDEAKDLLGHTSAMADGSGALAGGSVSNHTANLISSALSSSDSDVKTASQLLGGQAVKNKSGQPLSTMTDWAPKQVTRLNQLASAMPDGALRARTTSSANLVQQAAARAKALQPKVTCSALAGAKSDDLGPVPGTQCASPTTNPTQQPTTGTTPGHAKPGQPGTNNTRTGTKTGTAPGQGAGTTTTAPRGGSTDPKPSPPGLLPSLPITLPTSKVPVTVGSCGIGITLGPIGLHLGTCTNHS